MTAVGAFGSAILGFNSISYGKNKEVKAGSVFVDDNGGVTASFEDSPNEYVGKIIKMEVERLPSDK